jgi:hypothetical protein
MKLTSKFAAALVSIAAVHAAPALADTGGSEGRVVGLRLVSQSSDSYNSYRVQTTVDEGEGNFRVYTNGGIACNGRNLTDAQIAALNSALAQRSNLLILPSYKKGPAQYRCLVDFTLLSSDVPH